MYYEKQRHFQSTETALLVKFYNIARRMHFLLPEDSIYIYIGVALPRVFYAAKQFSLDFSFFRASSIKNILILLSVKGICRCRYQVIPLHEAPAVRPKYWNVKFIL